MIIELRNYCLTYIQQKLNDEFEIELELKRLGAEYCALCLEVQQKQFGRTGDVVAAVVTAGSTAIEKLGQAITEAFIQLDGVKHYKEAMYFTLAHQYIKKTLKFCLF